MDPQLTKQLIRRRLILENSLVTSTGNENENKTKNIEVSTDSIIPSNQTIKNNFLEKIRKFESFSDNQVKITQQIAVEKPQINFESVNKPYNKQYTDPALLKIKHDIIRKKLELDGIQNVCNNKKQNQNVINAKLKQFDSTSVQENKISKEKKRIQTTNEPPNTSNIKLSSKSDFNNWKIDKNWVFYTDYSHCNNTKIILKNKFSTKIKKNIGIIQTIKKFSRN